MMKKLIITLTLLLLTSPALAGDYDWSYGNDTYDTYDSYSDDSLNDTYDYDYSSSNTSKKKYLGKLSSNLYDSDSVSNPYGRYGSKYSADSINNPYGEYGNPYSTKSATNPYSTE